MEKSYSATQIKDLVMVTWSWVLVINHLMVKTIAFQSQVKILIISLKKVERTHSLIRKMDNSQLQSWKSGQSKKKNDHRERKINKYNTH
jgi:hypothetical protein